MGKTYFALAGCMPALILLFFFTDELTNFLDGIAVTYPAFFLTMHLLILPTLAISFIVTFLIHLRFIRKRSFALLATTHVTVQFLIITLCVYLAQVFVRENIINLTSFYLVFGFLFSVIVSDLGYIAEYLRSRPKHLIPIETILAKNPKKESEKRAQFIRLEGFLWVDFKTGIVVDRDETEIVISRLKTENVVLLFGNQASGKSMILRSLGYKLAQARYIVLVINADSLNVDSALIDIANWNMSNVVVLIDDVHRNPDLTVDLLKRAHPYNVKFILSSRPISVGIFQEEESARLVRLFQNSVRVRVSKAVIMKMILSYCHSIDYSGYSRLPHTLRNRYIANIIEKCGTDLWLISYFLESWNPRKSGIEEMAKSEIYRNIYETRVNKWLAIGIDALQTIQTICALYQYEIPCTESYLLENELSQVAFKLSLEGYLIKRGSFYYLHHPSVAEIYLETLNHYKLIESISEYTLHILSSYLRTEITERTRVFYKLATFHKTLGKEKETLSRMLESISLDELANEVQKEGNVRKISAFFNAISTLDKDFARKVLKRTSKSVEEKFLEESSIGTQKKLHSLISELNKKLARSLSDKRPSVGIILPLYNEEITTPGLIADLSDYVDVVIVIDDRSADRTSELAKQHGAHVILNPYHKGLASSIITGLHEALKKNVDIIILDTYPWIARSYIPSFIRSFKQRKFDLVFGNNPSGLSHTLVLNQKAAKIIRSYLDEISLIADRTILQSRRIGAGVRAARSPLLRALQTRWSFSDLDFVKQYFNEILKLGEMSVENFSGIRWTPRYLPRMRNPGIMFFLPYTFIEFITYFDRRTTASEALWNMMHSHQNPTRDLTKKITR